MNGPALVVGGVWQHDEAVVNQLLCALTKLIRLRRAVAPSRGD
jgi:hypothetical protein